MLTSSSPERLNTDVEPRSTARPPAASLRDAAVYLRVVDAPVRPTLSRLREALPAVAADLDRLERRLRVRVDFVRAAWRHRALLARFARSPTNPRLRDALTDAPHTLGVVLWPYVHAGWEPAQRVEAIDRHYRCLTGRRAGLHLLTGDRRDLAHLDDVAPGLLLTLDRPRWFQREGELVFSLCDGSERLYSVAFVLSPDADGLTATIGAVQGSSAPDILDRYRELTKALHGQRPRDFLLDAFRMLCSAIGVTALRAVGEACRHHRHPYMGRQPDVEFGNSYDAFWAEQEGVPGDDGFWRLPLARSVRSLEDIASKKRALYRRRYAFLDDLEARIAAGVRALPVRDVQDCDEPVRLEAGPWRWLGIRLTVLAAIVSVDVAYAAPWIG